MLIKNRRTIHEFKPEPAPVEKIRTAIDAARWAPNHHLTEPWHFYILGPQSIKGIVELNARLVREKKGDEAARIKTERWSQVPGWLVLTCDKSDDPVLMQEDYAACCCAAQNFMLYLWHEGIGVKWSTGGIIRAPEFYDLLWIDPAAESVVGMFWYGYAAEIPVATRKPAEGIIVDLP